MKRRTNLHTHTNYVDGANTPREMIESAIAKGFISLGFSEHAYCAADPGCCLTPENTPQFYREIRALKAEYADRITVFLGLETDGLSPFPTFGLDYCIGSIHTAVSPDGSIWTVDATPARLQNAIDTAFEGDPLKLVQAYFDRLVPFLIETKPDIIGHFDLYTKFNEEGQFFDTESPAYQKIVLEAADAVLKADGIFEINSGAISRGWRKTPYPDPFLLRHIREKGGRILISSDSHHADTLDTAFDLSVQRAINAGFTTCWELTENGFVEAPLV